MTIKQPFGPERQSPQPEFDAPSPMDEQYEELREDEEQRFAESGAIDDNFDENAGD